MHEVNSDKEKGDRDMKKRKMILSVMLLLSITTGCAAGEAKALSDSKSRMSLSQQIAKCNSKESAISIAENGIEKIFGANKYALEGDASYNQDSSIQPDGWFVQLYDGDWDYAVWITEDKNRIHFVRGGEAHPLEFISAQEMKEITESEEILDSANALVAEQLGDDREIRDAYFDNTEEGAPHNSVDVTLVMEDGHIYMLTFYKDGTLRSLLYLE